MPQTPRPTRKSPFFLFPFTLLLTLLLSLPWVSAKEAPKPKPQPWQIDGIVAAIDDSQDGVKGYAFEQLAKYEPQALKPMLKKPEDIARKAAHILKDEKVNAYVRSRAAQVLGNLGQAAQPYIKDIFDFLKNDKVEADVRSRAAQALGNLGQTAQPYIKDILDFLKDDKVEADVRSSAAQALGNLGQAAQPYIKDIADILKDDKVEAAVRGGAAQALGNLGQVAQPYIKDILDFVKNDKMEAWVRGGATEALGNLGQAAQPYIKDIADILKDDKVNAEVRRRAAQALGNLGQAAQPYIKDILDILKDDKVNADVRSSAAQALGNLGQAAQPYTKDIADILKNDKVEAWVRGSAAEALVNLGQAAQPYIKDILDFLKNDKVKAWVRGSAAEALVNLGQAAQPYIKDILDILKDDKVDASVRGSAAEALVNLGQAAQPYIKDILDFLKNDKVAAYPRGRAAQALGNIRKLELNEVVVVLDRVYEPNQQSVNFEQWRFLTYFLSGGTDDVKTLLKWLGYPSSEPIAAQLKQLKYEEGKTTLEVFRDAWRASQGLERLQKDLADKIAEVARVVSWRLKDIPLLQTHYKNLTSQHPTAADTVQSAINKVEVWKWFATTRNTILIHITFWLALIFAYPKFPQVQAIFFWNPWVRKILGVGYVGFLLTWVPFLRRKLFEPFKPSLLADAGLDNFTSQHYFPESKVKVPGSEEIKPITEALPSIQGQIVLEGDSGLGKSMFLRHLVTTSPRIVVHLPAQKCDKGVIEAIQDKLHGQAQDAEFLKNLIYSGAIDICIDGLNEVTADTRAKIVNFVECYFRGNIIMTTQPLEWTPPSTAKTYYLQPLERDQIQQFLITRQPRLPKDAKIQGADYEKACTHYVADALNHQQAPEELDAAQRTLSNPMDLSLVALMLSQGKTPDLFHLQEQQYNQMAEEYLHEWKHEFPLKKFSQAVYQMRLNDEKAVPAEIFHQELQSLEDEKYKMVVSRQWQDTEGKAKKEWYFRHDKIMDFFLVQNFFGEGAEAESRLIDHMGDPRFRGVYFLLATLLGLDEAKKLREQLIQYAADTKDHTVSDTFVQLLRTR